MTFFIHRIRHVLITRFEKNGPDSKSLNLNVRSNKGNLNESRFKNFCQKDFTLYYFNMIFAR